MEYALYKGDDLLVIGTIKEIAERTGAKEETIKFYNTASYKKRAKNGNRLVLIKIEED